MPPLESIDAPFQRNIRLADDRCYLKSTFADPASMADHPLSLWNGSGNLPPDQEAEARTSETEAETCHLIRIHEREP